MFVAGTQFATKHWAVPIENAPKHVENVQCGAYYVCIKTVDQNLWTMGQNENGQLCRKSVETKEPGLVDDPNIINKVVAVACGYDHTVIVLDNGDVWGVGRNSEGELGLGHINPCTTLTQIIDHTKFSDFIINVKSRGQHTILIARSGKIYANGWGTYGQLGLGTTADVLTPTAIQLPTSLGSVKEVVCGYYWTTFLDYNDNAWAVGRNENYRSGLSEDRMYTEITKVEHSALLRNVDKVACGWEFSIFLTKTNELYHCGERVFETSGMLTKVDLSSIGKYTILKNIFVGFTHAYLVTVNNDLIVCGNNSNNQLGQEGGFINVPKLVNMEDVGTFDNDLHVSSGWHHAVFYSRMFFLVILTGLATVLVHFNQKRLYRAMINAQLCDVDLCFDW